MKHPEDPPMSGGPRRVWRSLPGVSSIKSRLSTGEWLATGAGVLIIVSLFLPWFHEESVGRFSGAGDPGFKPHDLAAWTAIPVVAILLAALALIPLFNAVRRLRRGVSLRPEILLATGAVAVSLVFFGAALHVGERGQSLPGRPFVTASTSWGLGVGLVAALATAAAGVVAMWSTRPTRDASNTPRPTGGS